MLLLVIFTVGIPAASADECRSNQWQPTFVRHNSIGQYVYFYVEPNGSFTRLNTPQEYQNACRARGVRMRINGQDCRQRQFSDFGCGCNITPSPNETCRRFQDFLRVSGSEAARPGTEQNTDRPGGDFNRFVMPSPNPDVCRNACISDRRCRAWTYVRPGVQASQAVCWLKSVIPNPVPNTCCVSGVVRGTGSSPGSSPPPVRGGQPGGSRCNSNTDCATGICLLGVCSN
jgi:hypothetical protein